MFRAVLLALLLLSLSQSFYKVLMDAAPALGKGWWMCLGSSQNNRLLSGGLLCFRYLAKLTSVGSIANEETCERLRGLIQRQVHSAVQHSRWKAATIRRPIYLLTEFKLMSNSVEWNWNNRSETNPPKSKATHITRAEHRGEGGAPPVDSCAK